jgi:hypothetical protein
MEAALLTVGWQQKTQRKILANTQLVRVFIRYNWLFAHENSKVSIAN